MLNITLNRPEKKNAFNATLLNEFAFAMAYAHFNNAIWAVIIDAEGTVFSAGADLKSFAGGDDNDSVSTIPKPSGQIVIGNLMNGLHKPCIAKIEAPVFAGGHLVVCGCTHVLVTENVFFSLPEVKRGIWPMQVMQSLFEVMPRRMALDYCMRARKVNAPEALNMGLATQLSSAESIQKELDELIAEIKEQSPSAIRLGLKAAGELKAVSTENAHQFLHDKLMEVLQTEDAAEGIMAFSQRRKPVWTGK